MASNQIQADCSTCLGCNQLELPNFRGTSFCKQYVSADPPEPRQMEMDTTKSE